MNREKPTVEMNEDQETTKESQESLPDAVVNKLREANQRAQEALEIPPGETTEEAWARLGEFSKETMRAERLANIVKLQELIKLKEATLQELKNPKELTARITVLEQLTENELKLSKKRLQQLEEESAFWESQNQ